MPIPDPDTFEANTKAGFLRSYGAQMTRVLEALKLYWPYRDSTDVLTLEALLYNLWKEANRWLKNKEGKTSQLSQLRRPYVEELRRETLVRLGEVSPRARKAFDSYLGKKMFRGELNRQTKSLSPGYQLEREYYLNQGKRGHSIRWDLVTGSKFDRRKRLEKVGFKKLTVQDVVGMEQALEQGNFSVAYLNKMSRFRFMFAVRDGLFYDMDDAPVSMLLKGRNGYFMAPYAMDRYGNIFAKLDNLQGPPTVDLDTTTGTVQTLNGLRLNHSSFLGGREAICAGCIHIGWDVRRRALVPGKLSAIDNGSGHYKPTVENLRECVAALEEQGVDISMIRVGDWSMGDPVFYWGDNFLYENGSRPWVDFQTPDGFFRQAPPVNFGA